MTQGTNLLDYDREALAAFFVERGEKRFRADQVIQWVHQNGVNEFEHMSNISKSLRAWLADHCEISLPEIIRDEVSSDGTRKWLLKLHDGNAIETVFIPEADRGTLCISSQAGCILDCTFCATAQQGFSRNLSTGEILAQVWLAHRLLDAFNQRNRVISNIVMMGMGEPLANFSNVVGAIHIITDKDVGLGFSSRRITVSTAGLVPKLSDLGRETTVNLAISLNATENKTRDMLMPINRKYPIENLLNACAKYPLMTRRKITFEYILLKGINDSEEDAKRLVRLLRPIKAKINLIPFNTHQESQFECPEESVILKFKDILSKNNYTAIIRHSKGQDISAACGQLKANMI